MIILKITEQDINEAKETIAKFDSNKVYNKFKCKNNYIGVLGEILFHKYLMTNDIPHKWVEFIKESSSEPDFIINNKTIDIKTTYSPVMWYQTPIHDIYIYCHIVNDLLLITSYISREELVSSKFAQVVIREGRSDNVINPFFMHDLTKEVLIGGLK